MASFIIVTIFALCVLLEVNSKGFVLRDEYFKKSPFNGTCDKSVLCEAGFNCVSERCQCTSGKVYEPSSKVCWNIFETGGLTAKSVPCFHDVQCQAGSMGKFSRCILSTGMCQCFDHLFGGKREMVMIGGVCHVMRYLRDHCESRDECQKTIEGPVDCNEHTWRCECNNGFTPDKTRKSCEPIRNKSEDKCENMCEEDKPVTEKRHMKRGFSIKKFGDGCLFSYQCRKDMGTYSKSIKFQCQCHSPGGEETSYHPITHTCFLRKSYNDGCHDEEECQASLGLQVKCGHPPGISMETRKLCYCPFGKVCRSNKDMSSSTSFLSHSQIYSLVILAFAFLSAQNILPNI